MTDFRPTREQDLAEIVTAAIAREEPLELVAGGSKRALGRPLQLEHRLDLSGFSGIRSYEPEELVLTAGAATPLSEIEIALGAASQMLAFEPPDWRPILGARSTAQTLGGIIACNLAGPRRLRQGAARDHLLGFTAVSGRGEIFKAGGRVVKNVTGYDLCKLMAGSYGTLAALTEVTLKVLPRPEAVGSVVIHGLDDAGAVRAMTAGLNSSHELGGAAHLPAGSTPAGAALTLLRVEGPSPSVAARLEALRGELAAFGRIELLEDEASLILWRAIRDLAPLRGLEDHVIWRVSVPPSHGAAVVARLRPQLAFRYFLDSGGGLVWLAVAEAADGGERAIRVAVAEAGGHAMLLRAPAALRTALPVFQPLDAGVAALTARVKESFDPRRVLNPGRMYREL